MCPVKREINYSTSLFLFAPKVSNFAPIRCPKLIQATVQPQTTGSALTQGLSRDFHLFSLSHKNTFFVYKSKEDGYRIYLVISD